MISRFHLTTPEHSEHVATTYHILIVLCRKALDVDVFDIVRVPEDQLFDFTLSFEMVEHSTRRVIESNSAG